MDIPDTSFYRNQFNGPIDASALLGEQMMAGYDGIVWSEVEYRGSPLTDAILTLGMITDDWNELNVLLLDDLPEWALGENPWDDEDEKGHPYLGCNNDRMSHASKGKASRDRCCRKKTKTWCFIRSHSSQKL